MKSISGKQFSKILENRGWDLVRVNGSHHVYMKPDNPARISSRFAHFLGQFGRLMLFIEKPMQKYRLSSFNIIFLAIILVGYDIKSLLCDGFFMPKSENTIYSVFKSYEPLEKISER